jgi:hypothetical protein
LKNSLIIFIDDQEFANIPISGQDAGTVKDELIIWGYKVRKDDATNDMLRLSTLIETKRLEADLTLEKSDIYTSQSGEFFIFSLLYTALIVIVATALVFFMKYRKRGMIILPLILLCLAEFLLILGVVSFGWFVFIIFFFGVISILTKGEIRNWVSWVSVFLMFVIAIGMVMGKWVIGIPSIVGLMVVFLISIGQGVFMIYQFLKKRETYTITDYRLSMDKNWLFTTVAIVVFFILFLIGGQYREFAVTTSVGLFIASAIIIPVYYSIIEKVVK